MKVLLVDDDPNLRELLSDILKKKGIESVPAETGADALARIERQDIDVALIDLKLEDMSGLEVLRGIKERSSNTECILLTGYASQATAIQAINLGAYAYFQKPYDVEQLLVVIRRAVEKRATEEALKKSEARYRDLVENSQDLICTHDLQGNLLFVNEVGTTILGYSNEILLKMNLRDILAPDVRDRFDAYLAELQAKGQAHGLMRVQTAAGEIRYLEFTNTLQTESLAAPIARGTARDVTERKRTEVALRESEKKYQVLTEISPVGIFRTDAQGSTTYVNPRWSQISGLPAEDALGDGWLRAVHPQDREKLGEGWKQAARAQVSSISEYRFVRPDGSIAWVIGQSTPERNIQDQVIGYVGTITDITERKQAEEALQAAQAKYRTLVEQVSAVVYIDSLDEASSTLYISPQVKAMLGYSPEEWVAEPQMWLKVIHPDDLPAWKAENSRTNKSGERFALEYRLATRDGRTLWVRDEAVLVRDDSGQPLSWQGILVDITERKQAEEALRKTNELLETVFSNTHLMLAYLDRDFNFVRVNRTYAEADQRSPDFFPGQNHFALFPNAENQAIFQKVVDSGEPYYAYAKPFEFAEHPERGISYWDWSLVPIKDAAGRVSHLILGLVNVTERKQAEEALRKSDADLKEAQRVGRIGSWDWDATTDTINWSEEYYRIYGFDPKQRPPGYEEHLKAYTPESAERLDAAVKKSMQTGMPYELDLERASTDGARRWVTARCEIKRGANGQIVGLRGTAQDITERKQAEEALRESEVKYRTLVDEVNDGFYKSDRHGRLTFANRALARILGFENPETLIGRSFLEFVQPEEISDLTEQYQAAMTTGAGSKVITVEVARQDGTKAFIEIKPQVIFEDGRPAGNQGMVSDVTERKQAEEALRQAEEKYHDIFENSLDGIFQSTPAGRFITINPALARLWGYASPEDLIASVTDIAHQIFVDPDRRTDFVRLMKEVGKVSAFEFQALRKDGSVIWVSESAHAVQDAKGTLLYYEGAIKDITERKQAEQERLTHLRFFENMDKVNRAIQGTPDLEQMMSDALETTLSIFDCDRSWLLYPCDPDAPSFRVPMEITKPEYPGAKILNVDIPMSPGEAQTMREALESDAPVTYTAGTERPIATAKQFGVQSQMFVPVYPKLGKPWVFGMHQCSYPRVWTEDEKKLFQEIGRRLTDGLTSLLAYRDLRESEEMLRESQMIAGLGSYVLDFTSGMWISSNILDEIFGIDKAYIRSIGNWAALIHPDDRDQMLDYFTNEIAGKLAHFDKEYRIIRDNDKAERWVHGLGKLELDERGQPIRLRGTILDITERKQAEQALAASEAELRALFASMQDVVLVIDREGVYRKIAPTRPELLYKPPEELLGKNLRDVFPAEQAEAFLEAVRQTLVTRQTTRIEYELNIEGRPLWFSASISPMDNDNTLWVAHDITERKRAGEEIRRRAEELAVLYESSQALAGKISLDDVLQTITKSALRLFDATGIGLYLYDPATRMLEVKLATHPTIPIGLRLSLGEGLAGKVAQTRRAMRIDDYAAWEGRSPQYEGIPVRATLEMPLIYQDELVGVLVVHETGDSERKFTEADERLLSLFAAQSAAAIQNARLFEDLRLRLAEMETLQAVASACMAAENEDALLTRITELISETLYPDNFGFVMMGENGNVLLPHPSYRGVMLENTPAQVPLEGSIAGRVAASGQPYRTGDVRKEEMYLEINAATRSEICVPMLAGERVLGVINAESHQVERFSAQDERLLTILAGQVAIALERLRLQRETLRHLRELQVLLEVSQAATRVLELEPLLQNALDAVVNALPAAEKGCILLSDSAGNLQIRTMSGYRDRSILGSSFPPSSGYSARAFRERQPLIVAEARRDDEIRYDGEIEEMLQIQSAIVAPLMAQDQPIGVIALDNATRANAFTESDLRLLTTIAASVSVAVQNARLFEETRQRVVELKMLYESGLALGQLLNPKEIGQKIIELLEQKMDWHHTAIRLCRLQDNTLELLAFKQPGLDGEAEKRAVEERFKTLVSKSGEGLSGWAVQNSQTVRSGDVGNDPRYMDTYPGLHSGLYVPMKSGQRIIGVISIESEQPNAFSEADERLVSTLAAQAASALENARLFEETRQRVKELETLNRVSIALRAISKQEAMLAVVLEEALNALNASDGSINLLNNATGKLHQTIARGWPSEFSEALIQPGEGLFGNVFVSGNTHISRDFANDPLTRPEIRGQLPTGWGGACIPIRSTEQTLGVMLIAIPGGREFSKEQVRLLNTLAEMTGNALQRASLYEETLRRLENMQALREVDQVIASSFDLRLILNTVLSHTLSQLGVDAADVLSFNPALQTLEYAAGFGFRTRGIEHATRISEGHAGRAVLERQTVHVPNLPETGSNFLRASLLAGENFLEYYGVPLVSKGEVKGVLEVFHRSPLSPNPEWRELLETLAGQAAIAIDNAQLFENLQRSNLELAVAYEATIEGWSRAMDLRDQETEGHTLRVTEMAVNLARMFGMSGQELTHIRHGALLHDIGKMGVPDHILLKPGKLVDMEWALMQKHPQLAYEMLQPIQYLRESLDIPYCHHEKWDGTGYPRGLQGEQIPLAARLFAIVDVYDALTSDRPYRKAWPKAKALKYIREQSGLQFDPQVVNKFMEMFGDEKSKA